MDGYNIYLRQDGRWEGRISQGKKENGKRKFLYIFGKSREAVRNKIDELRKNSIRSTSKTVDELFGEWYKSICYRVKESTLANYRTKALNHILPEFGHIPASDINSDKMYSFIEKKRNEGLSNRYIGDIIVLMLPAGSVSGAPKSATIDLIKKAEGESRGFYTGVFGYYDGTELDSAVLIRFIESQNGQSYYRSGGGITAYSRCEEEYNEVLKKIYLPFV